MNTWKHYYEALVALKDSSKWKNPEHRGLRRWFEGNWQKQHKVCKRTRKIHPARTADLKYTVITFIVMSHYVRKSPQTFLKC